MKKILFLLFCFCGSFYNTAYATPPTLGCDNLLSCVLPDGEGAKSQHRVYIGLVWQMTKERNIWPAAQLGLSTLRIHSSNAIDGIDLSILANIRHELAFNSARLVYVVGASGIHDIQANLGAGYSFKKNAFFGTLAAQSIYSRAGIDYFFNLSKFNPYFEANTLASHTSTSLSCQDGRVLMDAAPIHAVAAVTKARQTCALREAIT